MATGEKPRKPGPEIPDLAAPKAAPRGAPKPAPPAAAPGPKTKSSLGPGPFSGPSEYFGSGNFDFEGLDDDRGPLALDTDHGSGSPERDATLESDALGAAEPEDFESTATSARKVQVSQSPARRAPAEAWPTGATPEPASIAIDSVEVDLCADYGPAPTNVALAPLYAARVLSRRRALKEKATALRAALVEAEGARDDVLRQLAESLRSSLGATEQGAALYAPVNEVENLADGRKKSLEGANVEYKSQADAIEHEIAKLEREHAAKKAVVESLEKALSERQRDFERTEARRKRLYIELRGILDVVEKSGQAATGEQSARIDALEAQIATHKPEVERAAAAKRDAEAALSAAERDVAAVERAGQDAERRRGGVDSRFQKHIGVREKGVSAAASERARALADIGRKVLAARGQLAPVPKETLGAISAADATVAQRASDLEKYVRAIDACDAPAVKRGLIAGGAAVAVLLVLLLSLAFHSSTPGGAAPATPATSSGE